jgi:hypothetical protein
MTEANQELLEAAKGVAAIMRATGQGYTAAADRIERYDSVPYPIPYVLMSTTIVRFLRALAAAEAAPAAPTAPIHAVPRYGPALRELGP